MSKTLLRLAVIVAVLLASSWWTEPQAPVSTFANPMHEAQAAQAAHLGNFDWVAAIGAAHSR